MPAGRSVRKSKAANAPEDPVRRVRKIAGPEERQFSSRRMRHRVMAKGNYVFGPGKADVLAAISTTGSLAAAARGLGMSYMRAWLLVKEMQRTFGKPLLVMQRGGKTQGGAALTPTGEKVLALYQKMEAEALAATAATWRNFCKLLRGA